MGLEVAQVNVAVDLFERAHFSLDHPLVTILSDTPPARVVLFTLEPGQQVNDHRNNSEVHMLALIGRGWIHLGQSTHDVTAGRWFFCPPGTSHGFGATERMIILATIAPRPRSWADPADSVGC